MACWLSRSGTPVFFRIYESTMHNETFHKQRRDSNPRFEEKAMDTLEAVISNKVSRRKFLHGVSAGVGVSAAASFAAGCSSSPGMIRTPTPVPTAYTDMDFLNFALNLEYLEAEFYLRAVTGSGLATADIGANPGAVTGGAKVAFATPAIQQYAVEIAADEQLHVQFLRSAITSLGGTPVSRPAIDFTNAFNTAASAAGIGSTFNPFADENSFIVGSFTFEDVGVTAYNGAGPLLTNKSTVLAAAGSIVAVEAYHAGLIRTLLAYLGAPYTTYANQISALRGQASSAVSGAISGAAETSVTANGNISIVAADGNSLAYNRAPEQVLHIVYLNATAGPVSKGGFFPAGLNGTITASIL